MKIIANQDVQRKNKTNNNGTKKSVNVEIITPKAIIITKRLLIIEM